VEVVLATVLLLTTGPLILLLAILVKLTSNGPGFYAQVRAGRDGRPCKIFKIRSMTHDCERQTGPKWSTAGDPRVTPLGRWLRKSHLDELPQLWNVLRGEVTRRLLRLLRWISSPTREGAGVERQGVISQMRTA
jgi:lipopolysaccharide/colanic/teichoic acid biosynthesis glycosyltransferase